MSQLICVIHFEGILGRNYVHKCINEQFVLNIQYCQTQINIKAILKRNYKKYLEVVKVASSF